MKQTLGVLALIILLAASLVWMGQRVASDHFYRSVNTATDRQIDAERARLAEEGMEMANRQPPPTTQEWESHRTRVDELRRRGHARYIKP